ncbi:MAG: HAMP domain-containing histidine kinase [Chloroflexi bacterium]|nr:MAG: HAMP domain-containing histidine kinase [Chloroflexota bacterium]
MPDGVATSGPDPTIAESLASDAGLIRTVRWRLVLWSGLSTLVVLAVLGVALYLVVARNLETTGINQLTFRSQQFAHFQDPRSGPGQGFSFGGGASGTFALIANDQGQAVGPGSFFMPSEFPIEAGIDAARTSGVDIRTTVVDGTPVRVRTEKADSNVGTVYIQVIQDRTAEQQTLDAIVRVLFLGGAVVVVVAVAFGAVYARRALVPIRESLASQRAALRRQREFAADASHELRTPLTVIRSSVEHLRRSRGADGSATTTEALDDIDAEVGHLTALVEDLLLLARSDSGAIMLNRLPVDLGDVAADGAGALAKLADERGVRLGLDPEPAMVKGDHARLRQLIVILVDNAVRHTPRGGSVRVQVRSDRQQAVLEVDDEGPGIQAEDMPRVFERFWRAPGAAAGGTGLGLAIAKSIVDLHDGRITVANRAEGGARFTVRLPAIDGPPAPAAQAGSVLATDESR